MNKTNCVDYGLLIGILVFLVVCMIYVLNAVFCLDIEPKIRASVLTSGVLLMAATAATVVSVIVHLMKKEDNLFTFENDGRKAV